MPRALLSAIQIREGVHPRGYAPSWESRAHAVARQAVYGDSTSEAWEAAWSAAKGAAGGAAIGALAAKHNKTSVGLGALRTALSVGSDDFLYTRRAQRAARGQLDDASEAKWSAARGAVLGGIDGALAVAAERKPGDGNLATRDLAIHSAMRGAITDGTAGFLNEKLAQRDDRAGTKRSYVGRKVRLGALHAAVNFVATNVRAEYNKSPSAASAKEQRANLVPNLAAKLVENTRDRTRAANLAADPYSVIQVFVERRASYV
jgi:hypothetical protein